MQVGSLPTKFPIPFANGAGPSYTRPIPQASQIGIQDGAASLTDGFPPRNFLPVSGGGVPPFGADHNGILNQITAWVRALSAGTVVPYDAGFQSAIGGYPRGAMVLSGATQNLVWQSQVDNNLTNPDASGAGWSTPIYFDPNTAGLTISGAGVNGAGLRLFAGGGALPSKWLRALNNGHFQIVNNAYSAAALDIDDAGNTIVTGSMSVAFGPRAGATGGQSLSVLLKDFSLGAASAGYQVLPNGFIIQWGSQAGPTGRLDAVTFPIAFPNACLQMVATEGGPGGWDTGPGTCWRGTCFACQPISNAQAQVSCAQIMFTGGTPGNPVTIQYQPDTFRWIAVGY